MPTTPSLLDQMELPGPIVLAGVHDALSARLAELAGFGGVWVSSLGVSASSKALPDANLLTLTDMLQMTWNIAARVGVPVVVDAENGYGDANNSRFATTGFRQAGAAAVCFEDNEFPKRNSFYERHCDLISIPAMQSKLAAARTAADGSMAIIARTEAMITGAGIAEALRRGSAYEAAGAQALVAHAHRWADAYTFSQQWGGRCPLVVIPTRFPQVRGPELAAAGFRIIIYANQALRAAVAAMSSAFGELRSDHAGDLEPELPSLAHLEGLVGVPQMLGGIDPSTEVR